VVRRVESARRAAADAAARLERTGRSFAFGAGGVIICRVDRAGRHEREHFFAAAKTVAALTVVSRVLGLLRDMAIVALGATRSTDAFWTAFSVPNLFRRLFGEGALSAAFVPVFTEVLEQPNGADRARVVLANAAGILAAILAGLVVLGELVLAAWLATSPGNWDRVLLVRLLMIVLPFMFTVCLLALGSAALNCRGHFAYPAFAPIILNICLIAAAVVCYRYLPQARTAGLYVLSGSVIVAGLVQLGGVLWLLRAAGLAAAARLRPVLPEVRRIAKLVLPMMIPLGVVQFSAFFDRFYAWFMTATPQSPTLEMFGATIRRPLQEGVVTCLYAANRLYQFPLGIMAISLATAVFPLLSRYASRGDVKALRQTTNRAIRMSIFLGVPAGVGLILLADRVIGLLFGHGRFSAGDVARAGAILRMYCLGMWAYFCNHILLRAFFAQKDARTPMIVSCILAVVNILLVVGLIFTPLGAAAVGLATAATASANTMVLTFVLRRRWTRLGGKAILASTLRTLIATGALAVLVAAVSAYVDPLARRFSESTEIGWSADALVIVAAVVGGAVVFLITAVILRSPELGELRRSMRRTRDNVSSSPPPDGA